jgi:hypothetical protein
MDDDEKRVGYEHLTVEVNCARDAGDINRLREIADDPQGFMVRQGWGRVALEYSEQHDRLRHLHEALEGRVISLLEALDTLHESAEYELHKLASSQPDFLLKVAESQSQDLEEEIKVLDGEMKKIDLEINELQS